MVSNPPSYLSKSNKERVRHSKVFTAKAYRAISGAPLQGSKANNSAVRPLRRVRTSLINLAPMPPLWRVLAAGPMETLKKRTALVSRLGIQGALAVPKGHRVPVVFFQVSKVTSSSTSTSRATSVARMDSSSPSNLAAHMDSLIKLNTINNTPPDRATGSKRSSS